MRRFGIGKSLFCSRSDGCRRDVQMQLPTARRKDRRRRNVQHGQRLSPERGLRALRAPARQLSSRWRLNRRRSDSWQRRRTHDGGGPVVLPDRWRMREPLSASTWNRHDCSRLVDSGACRPAARCSRARRRSGRLGSVSRPRRGTRGSPTIHRGTFRSTTPTPRSQMEGLQEVGRYYSAIPYYPDGGGGAFYPDGGANPSPSYLRATYPSAWGNCPSRTVIDLDGNMWVTNRAPDITYGSVTKVASEHQRLRGSKPRWGYSGDQPPDVNGNGVIDDFRDVHGGSRIGRVTRRRLRVHCFRWKQSPDHLGLRRVRSLLESSWELRTHPPVFQNKGGSVNDGDPWAEEQHQGSRARGSLSDSGFEGGTTGTIWAVNWWEQKVYAFNESDGVPQPVYFDGGMSWKLNWGGYGAIVDSQQRLWVVISPTSPIKLALFDTIHRQLR